MKKTLMKKLENVFYKNFCIHTNGKYYQKNKEKLWKEACERYQNLSEEEKHNGKKKSKTYIKIFLKKKEYKSILEYMKKNYFAHKKYLVTLKILG